MSNTTVLNVKIDKELKRQAQETAKALGLSVSTIVSVTLKDIVARRSITITDQPRLRPEVEAELLKISADAKKGINVSPTFESVEESFVWLDKELKKERAKAKK
jgi:addiction module RelB/DinJ family antitoxin